MPLRAKLHIATGLRQGRTFLNDSYCTQPFKIVDITENKTQKELVLMLMSSSPGILDGDDYNITIEVAEDTHLTLETQAYQRLFQMSRGASQNVTVHLAKGSSFQYLPHPMVPHQQSAFTSQTKIYLSGNSVLLWGEVISCGRKLNGEVFQFSSLHSITEIFLHGKLAVKENLLLKPSTMRLSSIGHFEGFTHQATLLFFDEKADVQEQIATLTALLNERPNIVFGVSALPVNGLALRMLGDRAEPLFYLLKKSALLLRGTHTIETIMRRPHVI